MHVVLRLASAVLALGLGTAVARADGADASPFLPVAGPATGSSQAAAADATYELAGASVTSHGSQLCIYDVQAKRSRWISVGETVDHIQVVSFDSDKDEAMIRVNGTPKSLALRKTVVSTSGSPGLPPSGYGMPPSPPVPSVNFPHPLDHRPANIVKQEREARMLVSDLLEIGIQQRRAYEEAQKAASHK